MVSYINDHLYKLAAFKQDLPYWENTGALVKKFIKYKYRQDSDQNKKQKFNYILTNLNSLGEKSELQHIL